MVNPEIMALMRKILMTRWCRVSGSGAGVSMSLTKTAMTMVMVDKLTYAGNLMSLAPVAQSERFAFEKVDICNGQNWRAYSLSISAL